VKGKGKLETFFLSRI